MGRRGSGKAIQGRRRPNARKTFRLKKNVVLPIIIVLLVIATSVTCFEVITNNFNKAKFNEKNDEVITDEDSYESVDLNSDDKTKENKLSLTVLGEIMMGGEITQKLDYNYLIAFKNVYNITNKSDFTYSTLATNITSLDTIEDAKSNYLVNKNILSAINALGIDALSIANDHITDFPQSVIKNTIEILENNSVFVAGKKDMPVYLEKDGKKIAIISTNSVIIGTKDIYEKNNISIYDESNIKKNIEEAQKNADFVIVDVHWGKGNFSFEVTDQIRQMAKFAIDNGADLVMGTHAVGIKPIEIYNEKPIIYTTGYIMTDLKSEEAKTGYIFGLKFNKDVKLESIKMTPTYINDLKETLLYTEFNKTNADAIMNNLSNEMNKNGVDSEVKEGSIVVNF